MRRQAVTHNDQAQGAGGGLIAGGSLSTAGFGGVIRRLTMRAIGLRPMQDRPRPGQRITVALKDGTQLTDCCATMICVEDRRGIVIYHGRKAIDETAAKGWWPKTPNVEVTGLGAASLPQGPCGLPGSNPDNQGD